MNNLFYVEIMKLQWLEITILHHNNIRHMQITFFFLSSIMVGLTLEEQLEVHTLLLHMITMLLLMNLVIAFIYFHLQLSFVFLFH